MTIALITTNPYSILATFDASPSLIRLPSGDVVEGAQVGWTGEGCVLVAVTPFSVPAGQQVVGAPSYAIDDSGNVTQSYQIEAVPVPIPTCQLWQLQAVMTAAQWTAAQNAVAALNNAAVSAFFAHGTNVIPANSTTLLSLGATIGLTAAQITALVQQASVVSIP